MADKLSAPDDEYDKDGAVLATIGSAVPGARVDVLVAPENFADNVRPRAVMSA